jgi:hypothetical protein
MTLKSQRKHSIPVTKGIYASGKQSFKERAVCEDLQSTALVVTHRWGRCTCLTEAANLGVILDTREVHIQLPVSEDRVAEVDDQAIHVGALEAIRGGSESNSHGELVAADCDEKVFDIEVHAGEHPVCVVRMQRAEEGSMFVSRCTRVPA